MLLTISEHERNTEILKYRNLLRQTITEDSESFSPNTFESIKFLYQLNDIDYIKQIRQHKFFPLARACVRVFYDANEYHLVDEYLTDDWILDYQLRTDLIIFNGLTRNIPNLLKLLNYEIDFQDEDCLLFLRDAFYYANQFPVFVEKTQLVEFTNHYWDKVKYIPSNNFPNTYLGL